MEYLTEISGYQVYKNSDGFLEGYKHSGKAVGKGSNGQKIFSSQKKIVTQETTLEGFKKFIAGTKKPKVQKIKPDTLFE